VELIEWKDHYKQKIKGEVDDFLEEHGYEYVTPNPINPPEAQIELLRERMVNKLTYEEYGISDGLQLIIDILPQRITSDEWDEVCWELCNVEVNALEFLEDQAGIADISQKDLIGVDEALGLSEKTYEHIRLLLFYFVQQEDYDSALEISKILIVFFHNRHPGWVGFARCQSWKGNDSLAIEVYKNVQNMFPKDPISRIFCSWSYVMLDEISLAKEQIQEGEQLLMLDEPDVVKLWEPIIADIKERILSRK
jgi:hypothetical protein